MLRLLAALTRPSCWRRPPSKLTEGAGKAGRRPRPWPASNKKSWRQSPQVWPGHPGLPCAMVLTVSFVLFLGTGLSCSHHRRNVSPTWHQRRDARTTRLLRPDRDRSSARTRHAATQPVHRIPRSTFVTIAKRPSYRVRDGADGASDLGLASSLFLNTRTILLRQTGTTGSLRMTRMRELPVAQKSIGRSQEAREIPPLARCLDENRYPTSLESASKDRVAGLTSPVRADRRRGHQLRCA